MEKDTWISEHSYRGTKVSNNLQKIGMKKELPIAHQNYQITIRPMKTIFISVKFGLARQSEH